MTEPAETPPWSFPIRLDQVGQGTARRLVATSEERTRVAEALDLVSVESLEAEVEVRPASRRAYAIEGRVTATVTQTCGVTLEPFPAQIDSRFSLRASEHVEDLPSAHDMEISLETPDPPDLIENGQIDLAAYAVEHLVLELDPFPRKPGVEFEAPAAETEPSPFAVLAQLRRDKPEG